MARSTPAQNDRGSASTTSRGPVAASQDRSAGVRGVHDRAHGRERAAARGRGQPAGLQVDRQGIRVRGRADPLDRLDRPDVHPQPEPAQGGGQRRRARHRDRVGSGPAHLVGDHQVARAQVGA
jgi:hypothetical protein